MSQQMRHCYSTIGTVDIHFQNEHKTLFQSTVDMHIQSAQNTQTTAKASILCVYFIILYKAFELCLSVNDVQM